MIDIEEEVRTYNELGAADKAALLFTRMISGNKITRSIFVVYSGLLQDGTNSNAAHSISHTKV